VDQEASGQGDLGRDPGALGGDGLLGHLDQQGLALLDHVLDGGRVPAPVAVVLVVFVLRKVGGVQECGLIGPDLYEGRLDPRQHRLDPAQVDVSHDPGRVGPLHQELDEDVVLENRHARFLRRGRYKNFSLHTSS